MGRIIIVGKDRSGRNVVVVYALTGRSSSSQARRIDHDDGIFYVKPTITKVPPEENENLLVYPALFVHKGIAVSNGRHTQDIKELLTTFQNPTVALASALDSWDYEPDAPHFTPRVSGIVISSRRAALSVVKRASDGNALKNYFEFPLSPGIGEMVATYNGKDQNPLTSFQGEPREIPLSQPGPEETAQEVYESLGPTAQNEDYRVSVACVYCRNIQSSQYRYSILNRCERKGE